MEEKVWAQVQPFNYGYISAKAEIEEFDMDDDMREVFERYTEEFGEDPESFLNEINLRFNVPATLKGKYPVCEFTKGYMQYCKEYINSE